MLLADDVMAFAAGETPPGMFLGMLALNFIPGGAILKGAGRAGKGLLGATNKALPSVGKGLPGPTPKLPRKTAPTPEHPTVGPKPSSTHVQRSTTDGTPFQSATPPPARGASNRLKGEYGETVSHEYFESLGYTRVSTPTHVNRSGIDAIYQKPDGSFVIVEAKFSSTGNGRLGNTKLDGPQMSDGWLKGDGDLANGFRGSGTNLILNAVDGDRGIATQIKEALESGGLEKVLTTIDGNGSLTAKLLS